MSRMIGILRERIAVVPLGINLAGYERRQRRGDTFRVGFFARVAPEKGLHLLADAYAQLRARTPHAKMRLDAAGYMNPAQVPYLEDIKRGLARAGLADEFMYHGAVDRDAKVEFLQTLDVMSVPAPDEPKGVSILEAMAVGVPVVQPRCGSFTEMVGKTGGGLLVPPNDTPALAAALQSLFDDRELNERLGQCGFDGVREHYSITTSTDRLLAVYESLSSA